MQLAHAGPGDRGHDTAVEEFGEPLAEPGRHGRVAGKERQQPDSDDRPDLGFAQPRRTAGGPRQQQIALVGKLLLLGEANPGKCSHAGVHAIHQPPIAKCLPGLRASLLHPRQQVRPDADGPAVGNRPDKPQIPAGRLSDRKRRHG